MAFTRVLRGFGLVLLAYSLAGCAGGPRAKGAFPPPSWTNALGMELVRIPAGEFEMGTSDADVKALVARFGESALRPERLAVEKPRHRVRITRDFLLACHEVTVAQFRRFVEATGHKTDAERGGGPHVLGISDVWEKTPDANWRSPGFKQEDNHPVVCVSWNDAQKFIEWLNAADRAKPRGWAYRLPTEAEWEFAARGRERREWAWGNEWDGSRTNYADKQSGLSWADQKADDGYPRTAPAGHYSPKGDTPQGVADMTGNVWEWCQDSFDAGYYQTSPVKDPVNKQAMPKRVERGGSWAFTPDYCRAAFRMGLEPAESYDTLGFRVVLARAHH
jgi:formylglycine-generating enzyme required for sulfatase activity